jgi:hypothetical protein
MYINDIHDGFFLNRSVILLNTEQKYMSTSYYVDVYE